MRAEGDSILLEHKVHISSLSKTVYDYYYQRVTPL
jgi:hypothetical protein